MTDAEIREARTVMAAWRRPENFIGAERYFHEALGKALDEILILRAELANARASSSGTVIPAEPSPPPGGPFVPGSLTAHLEHW